MSDDQVIEFGIPFYLSNGKQSKVKPFFANYTAWEDYINGMYNNQNYSTIDTDIANAKRMLSDRFLFSQTIDNVFLYWPISTKVNLTNSNCNKRAWVGASCCSYEFKVPEIITRAAWGQLTIGEQKIANKIAQDKINYWILVYKNKRYAKNQIRIECF